MFTLIVYISFDPYWKSILWLSVTPNKSCKSSLPGAGFHCILLLAWGGKHSFNPPCPTQTESFDSGFTWLCLFLFKLLLISILRGLCWDRPICTEQSASWKKGTKYTCVVQTDTERYLVCTKVDQTVDLCLMLFHLFLITFPRLVEYS